MAAEWYYSFEDVVHGPFEAQTIREMAARGDLKPTDRICLGLHGKWVEAGQLKGLAFGRQDSNKWLSSLDIAVAKCRKWFAAARGIALPAFAKFACQWFAYPIMVVLVAVVALAWNYGQGDKLRDTDPNAKILVARSLMLTSDGRYNWNTWNNNQEDKVPDTSPQTKLLFARSWVRTSEDKKDSWSWTFSRNELNVQPLDRRGVPTGTLLASDTWHVERKPGILELTGVSGGELFDGIQGVRARYLIRTLTNDSLVLEPEVDGKPTGKLVSFAGRDRVKSKSGPPFWAYVLIQVVAALLAHSAAWIRVPGLGRFGMYLGLHLIIAVVLSPVAFLFPEEGEGLAQKIFVIATIASGLLLGLIGAVLHFSGPQPTAFGTPDSSEPLRDATDLPPHIDPQPQTAPQLQISRPVQGVNQMNPITLVFRFASPSCWCAAILFFFLPWIDISCSDDRKAGRQETMSGAQLAWGGNTRRVDGQVIESRTGPPNDFWDEPQEKIGCVLLNAYILGLVVCAIFTPFLTPCATRGAFGFLIGLVLLGCLYGGCALLANDEPFSKYSELLLRWYYASYVANGLVVAFFLVELCFLGDFSHRKARHAPL